MDQRIRIQFFTVTVTIIISKQKNILIHTFFQNWKVYYAVQYSTALSSLLLDIGLQQIIKAMISAEEVIAF